MRKPLFGFGCNIGNAINCVAAPYLLQDMASFFCSAQIFYPLAVFLSMGIFYGGWNFFCRLGFFLSVGNFFLFVGIFVPAGIFLSVGIFFVGWNFFLSVGARNFSKCPDPSKNQ